MKNACSSGCPTPGAHRTYGECLRSKNLQSSLRVCRDSAKAWDRELAEYRSAVEQGIQPNSTKTKDIRAAVEASNKQGAAFGVDFNAATPLGDI